MALTLFGWNLFGAAANAEVAGKSFYDLPAKSIQGKAVDLHAFKGKVLLVVNTASQCGFTSQYKDLQALHDRFQAQGFEVLGFPSNDFGGQEPGSNSEIAKFCEINFGVTFPLFEKGPVKGKDRQIVFEWLAAQKNSSGRILWNFEKFLIGKDGQVIDRFRSITSPTSAKLISAIEAALKK